MLLVDVRAFRAAIIQQQPCIAHLSCAQISHAGRYFLHAGAFCISLHNARQLPLSSLALYLTSLHYQLVNHLS